MLDCTQEATSHVASQSRRGRTKVNVTKLSSKNARKFYQARKKELGECQHVSREMAGLGIARHVPEPSLTPILLTVLDLHYTKVSGDLTRMFGSYQNSNKYRVLPTPRRRTR